MAANLQSPLHQKKDELLDLFKEALRTIGLNDLEIDSIHLRVSKRPLICPPGETAVWGPIERPNGLVTYGWICRKS